MTVERSDPGLLVWSEQSRALCLWPVNQAMRAFPPLLSSDDRRGGEAREQGDGEKNKFAGVRCEDRCHGTFPYSQNGVGTDGVSYAKRMPCTYGAYIRIFREKRSIDEEIVSLRWRCTRMSVERRGKGRKKLPRDGKKGPSVGGLHVLRAVTGRYEEKRSERRNNPVNDQSEAK